MTHSLLALALFGAVTLWLAYRFALCVVRYFDGRELSEREVLDLMLRARRVEPGPLDVRELRRQLVYFWTMFYKFRHGRYRVRRWLKLDVEEELSYAAALLRAELRTRRGATDVEDDLDARAAEASIGAAASGDWKITDLQEAA